MAAILVQVIFWRWTGWQLNRQAPLPVIGAGLLLSLAAAWVCGLAVRVSRRQAALQQRLEQSEVQLDTMKTFLGGSLRMDTELPGADDETQVMETTLSVICELTGARGASFVPLDEWGQPLPAHLYGKLPPLLRKSWSDLSASRELRHACRTCQQHQALPGEVCPLAPDLVNEAMGVFCFPLQRGQRLLGMVNLYRPDPPELTPEQNRYLTGLLNEAALAVETVRLKNRESATLRQLQMLRPPLVELSALLPGLLESLLQVLEVDALLLFVRPSPDGRQPALELRQGSSPLLDSPAAPGLLRQVTDEGRPVFPAAGESGLAAIPLVLPDGHVLGGILLASRAPFAMTPRRDSILQSVADQAALLVENERIILSLEFRTVLQERARLAREIHDGLAQTLAFLKLQASQMQVYLAQGNTGRLSQMLKQNYDALAEAYQDTRQTIDNLRLNPEQSLRDWLDPMLDEFETAAGLPVERSFAEALHEPAPEVQLQLIRIVQEALTNIRKHAGARQVRITLKNWNGDLILEISDDGQGFSPEQMPGLSQHGLRGMRERAELIGAEFQVISQPQQGTVVRLSIPEHSQETWL